MKKSCKYCGRIHSSGYACPSKPKRICRSRRDDLTDQQNFRSSQVWKDVASAVRARDGNLCQACLNNLRGTERQYNNERLSVHHIEPLAEDLSKGIDMNNLITLCHMHHELAEAGLISRDELHALAESRAEVGPPGLFA